MNFNQLKKELEEKLGNYCYCYMGNICCFTRCKDISNDVRVKIKQFDGEADYFIANFEFNLNNQDSKNHKKYKNVYDFISDFMNITKVTREKERVCDSIISK